MKIRIKGKQEFFMVLRVFSIISLFLLASAIAYAGVFIDKGAVDWDEKFERKWNQTPLTINSSFKLGINASYSDINITRVLISYGDINATNVNATAMKIGNTINITSAGISTRTGDLKIDSSTGDISFFGGFGNAGLTLQKGGNIFMDGSLHLLGNFTNTDINSLTINSSLEITDNFGNRNFFFNGTKQFLEVVGDVSIGRSINATSINITGNSYFATITGNVGIGTTAPAYKLTVAGNANISGARFISNSFINFTNNTAFNETLYILNGQVGIGTAFPNDILEVVGNVRVSGSLNTTNLNTTGQTILASSSGKVGIGTTEPSTTLEVVGNFNVTGQSNNTIGNFSIRQTNSTCAGFRFNATGGLILSCAS